MSVVFTLPDKCRRCYYCVRECPVKAIRVIGGQAEVVEDLCISCGTCLRVCHQKAKTYRDDVPRLEKMLAEDQPIVAILAPSFVASFTDVKPGQVVEATSQLGFDAVVEVAFGAELVADAYSSFVDDFESGAEVAGKAPYISTPCPAVVNFVEKHHPELMPHMVPIVSPMVALSRYLKARAREKGEPVPSIAFFGPCTAKKAETDWGLPEDDDPEIALTFRELAAMFSDRDIDVAKLPSREFDPPHPTLARLFPVSGGLIRSAALAADILDSSILVAEGKEDVEDVISSVANGRVDYHFVDLLFCEGCIDGPVIDSDLSLMERRERVVKYTREARKLRESEPRELPRGLDLSRRFRPRDVSLPLPDESEIRRILSRVGKHDPSDELNCGACGYPTCRDKAIAVYRGLAEPEMCLPYMVEQLEEALEELEYSYGELHSTYDKLQETQEELVQAEKLSSLGQLSAGVAHELNNPLGGILLYADLIREEQAPGEVEDYVKTIRREAARCRDIVTGLLNFARQSRVQKEEVALNEYVASVSEDFARGLPEDIKLRLNLDSSDQLRAELDPGQMRRVLINLLGNSRDAVGDAGEITISTRYLEGEDEILIAVEDDGVGIRESDMSRVFTPFFTTKEPGKGTGLGMPIAYGIVKMHRGKIEVNSEEGRGTEVTISIPRRSAPDTTPELLGVDRERPFT
ncbi:MAG: [Fe-Fe] hydrogenase large subunit C-terminal domain-containing protein [Bacillota bacterium]